MIPLKFWGNLVQSSSARRSAFRTLIATKNAPFPAPFQPSSYGVDFPPKFGRCLAATSYEKWVDLDTDGLSMIPVKFGGGRGQSASTDAPFCTIIADSDVQFADPFHPTRRPDFTQVSVAPYPRLCTRTASVWIPMIVRDFHKIMGGVLGDFPTPQWPPILSLIEAKDGASPAPFQSSPRGLDFIQNSADPAAISYQKGFDLHVDGPRDFPKIRRRSRAIYRRPKRPNSEL